MFIYGVVAGIGNGTEPGMMIFSCRTPKHLDRIDKEHSNRARLTNADDFLFRIKWYTHSDHPDLSGEGPWQTALVCTAFRAFSHALQLKDYIFRAKINFTGLLHYQTPLLSTLWGDGAWSLELQITGDECDCSWGYFIYAKSHTGRRDCLRSWQQFWHQCHRRLPWDQSERVALTNVNWTYSHASNREGTRYRL